MGTFTPLHWILVIAVIALVFGGRGKLSSLMGDAAKGIRAFKDGLKGEDAADAPQPAPPIAQREPEKEEVRR